MSRNEPPQNRRVNVRGIIVKDGKLFCQKLNNSHTIHTNEFWCTPGGGIDFGESLQEGLHREMVEETGVEPEIGHLLFIQQFMDGEREQLEFFFHIKNADDYEVLDLENTSHGVREVAEYGFVDPKTEHVLPAFLKEVDVIDYTTNPRPVFIAYPDK